MSSLDKKDLTTTTVYLGKKNSISRFKEANNSKEVELLLKDIKTAAIKRVNSISEKQNRKKHLKDFHDKNVGNGYESQENPLPKIADQTRFLKQNGNSLICKNSVGCLDNKKENSENGTKNGVSSFTNENKHASICDNISANINQSSKIAEDSCLRNGKITSHSQEIMYSKGDEKDTNDSGKNKNGTKGSDTLREKKVLSNNKNLTDIEKSEMMKDGTLKNEMISSQLIKTGKNGLQEESTGKTLQKVNSKVKVIEKIIQENKMLKNLVGEPVLSGNIATKKQLHTIETMADKEPTDSENEDKDDSPNFTSSVSEEEDPIEEGICIIINGKRLPPSSESELEILRNSKEKLTDDSKDGTDLNQSRDSVFGSIENILDVPDSAETALNISDNSIDQSNSDIKTDILSAILDMTSKTKSEKTNILDGLDTLTKNKKSIRPIIHNFLGDTHQEPARTQSLNIKSVTFSQDTVFNEDKTKRYRKERVSLRNVYRNRISGFEAYAKINPLFEDDSDEGEGYAATVNHKSFLERKGSFIYHGDDKNSSTENSEEDDSPIEKAKVLNFPSYMQKFLQNDSNLTAAVAKITSEDDCESEVSENQNSSKDQPNENSTSSSNSCAKVETAEVPNIKVTNPDKDEVHLTLGPEVPGYDVLIKKTIAKEQHHFFMKCSITFLFVCGLLAIIAIIVYFLIIKR